MAQIGWLTSSAPYKAWRAISNGDAFGPGTANPELPDAIYVGTTGTLVLVDVNGNSVSLLAATAGTILPLQPRTATTVTTGCLALFR
jgi:hypothetical protein